MSIAPDRTAATDVPVLDVVAQRFSTRVFDAHAPLDEDAFASALEAARWAPSAYNAQPWRFLVVRRGTPEHAKVVATLSGFNQEWASNAAALVVVVAETAAEGRALTHAVYDAGQSAAYFTVQAHARGLYTHQMSGFDAASLAAAFEIAEPLVPLTVIAVGSLGDLDQAPAPVQEREHAPRTRRPLAETVLVNS